MNNPLLCRVLMGAALVSACGMKERVGPGDRPRGAIELSFRHVGKGQPLDGEAQYLTLGPGRDYVVSRLEYLLSDIRLEGEERFVYPLARHHYVKHGAPETLRLVASVPEGYYSGLNFVFGLPAADNAPHGGLPPSKDLASLDWEAHQEGLYHYMKLEGVVRAGGQAQPFQIFTGPSKGNDYSFRDNLTTETTVFEGRTTRLVLTMDVNTWFDGPRAYNLAESPTLAKDAAADHERLRDNGCRAFTLKALPPDQQ